jgi:shikimate dehydrogenase
MSDNTYQLALFGHPVEHSLSPQIHQQFAQQFDIKIGYQLIDVESEDFLQQVIQFFHAGGHGANVTLPHKQQARQIVSKISKITKLSQAVNTLYLNDNHEICGENTDGYGFLLDLKKRCGFVCQNKNILILGAGGATQGIVPAILSQKPNKIVIANRTLEKAQEIARFKQTSALSLQQLAEYTETFDLIIHSSSLGHQGKSLEFSQAHVHEHTLCYDLSYGKAAVPFLLFAKKLGVNQTFDGIGMLIQQAAKSFEIWFGKKPKTGSIIINS